MDFRMKFDNDASIAYGQEEQNCKINGKLLDSLFEEFIDANPELADEICIEEFGTKTSISYRELNSRANKLARVLIDKVKLVYLQNNMILFSESRHYDKVIHPKYSKHFQAYTLPHTLNCICVSLF